MGANGANPWLALIPAVTGPLMGGIAANQQRKAYDELLGRVEGAYGRADAQLGQFERRGIGLINAQLADVAGATSANASAFVSRARRRSRGTAAGIFGAGARNAGSVNAGRLLGRSLPALGQSVAQGRASLASQLAQSLAMLGPRPDVWSGVAQGMSGGLTSAATLFDLLSKDN